MADQFQFDTSGYIQCLAPDQKPTITPGFLFWCDLSPGVQGCIAGMLEEVWNGLDRDTQEGMEATGQQTGFFDLHHDTLARIIADWDRFEREHILGKTLSGEAYWKMRQAGDLHSQFTTCLPVTPYLNDQGMVYLKDRT